MFRLHFVWHLSLLLLVAVGIPDGSKATELGERTATEPIAVQVGEFNARLADQTDSELASALRQGLVFSLQAYPEIKIVPAAGEPEKADLGAMPDPSAEDTVRTTTSRLEAVGPSQEERKVFYLNGSYYKDGALVDLRYEVTLGPERSSLYGDNLKFERRAALATMESLARRLVSQLVAHQKGVSAATPAPWRRGLVGCFESTGQADTEIALDQLAGVVGEELARELAGSFPDLLVSTSEELEMDCDAATPEAMLKMGKGFNFSVSGRIESDPTSYSMKLKLFAVGFPTTLRLPVVQVPHEAWYDLERVAFSQIANFLFAGRDEQGFWNEPQLVLQQDQPEKLILTGRDRLESDQPNKAALYFILARDRSETGDHLHDEASLGLARSRYEQGLNGEAHKILEDIDESAEVAGEASQMLGDMAFEAGKFDEARDSYLKAYELGNRSGNLLWRAAESLLRESDQQPAGKQQAHRFLDEWVDRKPVDFNRFVSAASILDQYGAEEQAGRILLKASTVEVEPEANTLDTSWDLVAVYSEAAESGRYDIAKRIGDRTVALAKTQEAVEGLFSLGLGYTMLGFSESILYADGKGGEIDAILDDHRLALGIFSFFRNDVSQDLDTDVLDILYRMELLNYSEAAFIAQEYETSRTKSLESIATFSDLSNREIASDLQSKIVVSYLLLTISEIMTDRDETESLAVLKRERTRLGDAGLDWDFSFINRAISEQMKDLCDGTAEDGCERMTRVQRIIEGFDES